MGVRATPHVFLKAYLPPAREEVTWQPASFCSYQNYSKHYRVLMKFMKNVDNGPRSQDNYILVMFWIPGGP